MKYFSLSQIKESLRLLRPHHVILGTTFFVLKKEKVPIGKKIKFSLDAANHEFLETHYRIHPKSLHFFRVMRQGNPDKDWNEPDYAGKGLQSVNTRGCPNAFVHDKNDNTWGWSVSYIDALSEKLPRGIKFPLFHLAVWLYREKAWPDNTSREEIENKIIKEYSITKQEIAGLFSTEIVSNLSSNEAFQELPVKWHQVLAGYSTPKDVPPERSGILSYLETQELGPVGQLVFEPSKRLNIVTGDNGLGKTFLLDVAWWALTQDWADKPAWPMSTIARKEAIIKFVVSGNEEGRAVRAKFIQKSSRWELLDDRPTISGLVIYARVDGSFAVWDPINPNLSDFSKNDSWPGAKFSREEVLNGKGHQIEGLIRDWVRWQERPDKYPAFETFKKVLERVSPPDLGKLEIGEPIRFPFDSRLIPTIIHRYGRSPILFESAGVRRIVTLAYLIVWAWEEHKIQAKQAGKKEERQMVVILDEAEAHLHPKWQRVILPALLGIAGDLHQELSLQLIAATHSPLVLASSEPIFEPEQDKLFLLDMGASGKVDFREMPFEVRGSIDSWLTSPLFQLNQPGSSEREHAIREAVRLQESSDVKKNQVEEVTNLLRSSLSPEDAFWVRWIFFAEKHGVRL